MNLSKVTVTATVTNPTHLFCISQRSTPSMRSIDQNDFGYNVFIFPVAAIALAYAFARYPTPVRQIYEHI